MTLKKFISPFAAILLVLSAFWITGVDAVIQPEDELEKNIRKYVEVQRRILNNYVEPVSITLLYKKSIKGMVSGLNDSTAVLENTPLDTTFAGLKIDGLGESVKKFKAAYLYMLQTYPDEDMTKRTADAIRGMISALDPHSIYIEPRQSQMIESSFKGSFSGIGIMFNVIRDTITVITPITGGPSAQLGIQAGDRIIAIEDSSSVGFKNQEVINTLRGPKGSEVDVTIKRPGTPELLNFTITRDEIPLYTVDTAYLLDEKTGYISINRFAATTHKEFIEAMAALKQKGMERLILDLRNNPGGYLSQAIAIAGEFFPEGTELVSTQSRHLRFTDSFFTRTDGKFPHMPLIILVNRGSASASEIVSGAVQDHDRGLIVGQRTFGKGLVQQQYQLVDSSNVRVTISRYYTPSGRLIQKPYEIDSEGEYALEIYRRNDALTDVRQFLSHVPDSLKHYTDAGRVVYGGGGIVPDHIVQPDTTQSFAVANLMTRKRIGFHFVRAFLNEHGEQFKNEWGDHFMRFREEFEWTEQNMNDLISLLQKRGMVVADTVSKPEFESDTLYIPPGHFEEVKWMMAGLTKAQLARQVWGLEKYYPVYNDVFGKAIEKAMTMWGEVYALKKYAANHSARAVSPEASRIKRIQQ